jgi:predicted DNA-binding transcriptional regulator YafY
MFTRKEAQALVAAVRIAQTWLDPALAAASNDALSRVLSVLPSADRAAAESMPVMAPPLGIEPGTQAALQALREAAQAKRKARLQYCDLAELRSERSVRPLGVFYWGKVWTLAAWCESRQDHRSFRIDRIEGLVVLSESFRDEPGKSLQDMLRSHRKP